MPTRRLNGTAFLFPAPSPCGKEEKRKERRKKGLVAGTCHCGCRDTRTTASAWLGREFVSYPPARGVVVPWWWWGSGWMSGSPAVRPAPPRTRQAPTPTRSPTAPAPAPPASVRPGKIRSPAARRHSCVPLPALTLLIEESTANQTPSTAGPSTGCHFGHGESDPPPSHRRRAGRRPT